MSTETSPVEVKKAVYGELHEADMELLKEFRELFQAVASGHAQFNLIAEETARKLVAIIRDGGLDLALKRNIDAVELHSQAEVGKRYMDDVSESATDSEILFSKDMVGLIDFAVKNGIGFDLVANIMSHDLAEILRHGSLDKALGYAFRPKCDGYNEYGEDSVGEVIPDHDY